MTPPVVYLDTQDFSRFGDVLRGKADGSTEALFLDLENRKKAGNVIFAASMPILAELLQYDAGYRETTIFKAQAVERLCGGWALAFPSRLIAAEIGMAARGRGLLAEGPVIEVLSSDRYWYPHIADLFQDLRSQIREGVSGELEALRLPSRHMRRAAKKIVSKMDVAAAARDIVPQISAEYGLPPEVFTRSIVALLDKSITPTQAGHLLFSAIAEPVKFVETYFEKIESDRTLPTWISGFGREFEDRFIKIRDALKPYLHVAPAHNEIERTLTDWSADLSKVALSMAGNDVAEIGIDAVRRDQFASDPDLVALIPSAQVIGRVLPAYVRQILGFTGQQAKVERSFGGDLVHALYLPHVDLWRGDRRFSAVVSGAMPKYADRVVNSAKALPEVIDSWLARDLDSGVE